MKTKICEGKGETWRDVKMQIGQLGKETIWIKGKEEGKRGEDKNM